MTHAQEPTRLEEVLCGLVKGRWTAASARRIEELKTAYSGDRWAESGIPYAAFARPAALSCLLAAGVSPNKVVPGSVLTSSW